MPFAITITGPSGSGKSTVLRHIEDVATGVGVRTSIIERYTTRQRRSDDGPELTIVEQIPRACDLVYEQYGVRYGFQSSLLFDSISRGEAPVIIVNDIRTVADVKTMLGPLAKALFLFRSSPGLQRYIRLALTRAVMHPESDAERRFLKANAIYRIYIENIQLFDHVVVNAGTLDDLKRQIERIVRGIEGSDRVWPLRAPTSGADVS